MTLAARELVLAGRLDGVTLALERGAITAICGPNGAGKSSLLASLAGLLTPDHGEVSLDGSPLSALPPRARARAIGYLPQDGEVAWNVTIASLVALGRLPHGDAGEAAVDRALAACELEVLAARRVSTLSGGEKARALLARVLAGEPDWILADEPFAALDLAHRQALAKVLCAEAAAGKGVVLVVHDLALAMNLADRVIVLDAGRTTADGAPAEALSLDIIRDVWGVEARWLGDEGRRALLC